MRFPNSVDDLIRKLDELFPEPAIGPEDTMDQIKYRGGQRSVVTYLKQWRATAALPEQEPRQRGRGRDVRRKDPKD